MFFPACNKNPRNKRTLFCLLAFCALYVAGGAVGIALDAPSASGSDDNLSFYIALSASGVIMGVLILVFERGEKRREERAAAAASLEEAEAQRREQGQAPPPEEVVSEPPPAYEEGMYAPPSYEEALRQARVAKEEAERELRGG